MSSAHTAVPFIPVEDPGTTAEEFVPTLATPEIKLFTKHWVPSSVTAGKPPVAALLFVHGFNENIWRYDHVFPVFASKGIYVTAYDQRGYGVTAEKGMPGDWKKENHSDTTLELLFQDLNQVILAERKRMDDQYGPGRVPFILMGHSMGGQLALSAVTRPEGYPYLPPSTTEGLAGVVGCAPWLRLTHPPPGIVQTLAKGVLKLVPNFPWINPIQAEDLCSDPVVQDDARKNPYLQPRVYLRAIAGPLLNGYDILQDKYRNFPRHLPLLLVHGDADPVVDYHGSVEFEQKVQADDKELVTFERHRHEPLQEPMEERTKAANLISDWILKHAQQHSSSAQVNGETVKAGQKGINGFAKANGINGTAVNGTAVNGTAVNGTAVNGTAVNGTALNGTASHETSTWSELGSRREPRPHNIINGPTGLKAAWATLLTADNYLPGLLVFSYSLLHGLDGQPGSRYPLVVMVTPEVSTQTRAVVRQLGCQVHEVQALIPKQEGKSLAQARFSQVWTKLRSFELEEFDRVGLVDSDMLVRRNMDDVMDVPLPGEENPSADACQIGIAASSACTCNPRKVPTYPPDWIPANCAFTPQAHPLSASKGLQLERKSPPTYHLVNSGLVILRPSVKQMIKMAERIQVDPDVPHYRFPDQDFLAKVFHGNVTFLPYVYNALKPLRQCHPALWSDDHVRNVHYILSKPWTVGNYDHPQASAAFADHPDKITHGWWWATYPSATAYARREEKGNLLRDDKVWHQMIAQYVRADPPEVAAQHAPHG